MVLSAFPAKMMHKYSAWFAEKWLGLIRNQVGLCFHAAINKGRLPIGVLFDLLCLESVGTWHDLE